MNLSMTFCVTSIIVGILAFPAVTQGQARTQGAFDCEAFDDCALRIRHRLIRTEIVQGTESIEVARIGLRNPPLQDLFARSDRAAVSFDEFRKDHRRASWLTVLGGIEIIGALVARAQDNEDWANALSISGIVIEVAGMIFRTRADEHLSDAIWWYNRSLAGEGVR